MAHDHLREYTKREIVNLLYAHGFDVLSYRGIYFNIPLGRIISYLYTSKLTSKLMLFTNTFFERLFPKYYTYHLLISRRQF